MSLRNRDGIKIMIKLDDVTKENMTELKLGSNWLKF